MLRSSTAILSLAVFSLLACAPPPPQVIAMPAPMPVVPRVIDGPAPAEPLAGVLLTPQAVGDRAYGGGGAVLEHRNGMTRQLP
jgi:hypothetical protein